MARSVAQDSKNLSVGDYSGIGGGGASSSEGDDDGAKDQIAQEMQDWCEEV